MEDQSNTSRRDADDQDDDGIVDRIKQVLP